MAKLSLNTYFYFIFSVLPHNGPHITGERKQYQVGDELSLNCSSGKSYPESVLKWYINENEVLMDHIMFLFLLSPLKIHAFLKTRWSEVKTVDNFVFQNLECF